MAIRHGLAGQYGKGEAKHRSKQVVFAIWWVLSISIGGASFAWGFFWSWWGQWFGLLAVLLLCIPITFLWRKLDRFIDEKSKERLKFLRGGQAEAFVSYLLETEIGSGWHFFNAVKLDHQSDHDHIIVGPGGMFLISTKSQRGWFVGSAAELRHNMKPCSFAQDALRQTAKLAARLNALMGEGVPWIQAILCVPFGYTDGDVFNRKVLLAHADNLSETIAPEKPEKTLTKHQIARVVKAMEMIQADAATVYDRFATAK